MAAGDDDGKVVAPYFKMVFLSVLGLTVVMLGVTVWLSIGFSHPDGNINSTISTTSSLCKIGFGAIAGLIGGRVG